LRKISGNYWIFFFGKLLGFILFSYYLYDFRSVVDVSNPEVDHKTPGVIPIYHPAGLSSPSVPPNSPTDMPKTVTPPVQ